MSLSLPACHLFHTSMLCIVSYLILFQKSIQRNDLMNLFIYKYLKQIVMVYCNMSDKCHSKSTMDK
jgi:hypothetical protein